MTSPIPNHTSAQEEEFAQLLILFSQVNFVFVRNNLMFQDISPLPREIFQIR